VNQPNTNSREFTDRWVVDPTFQRVLSSITSGKPATEWVPDCPVVQHSRSQTEANDLRGMALDHIQIGAMDLSDSVFDFARFTSVTFERTGLQWSCMNHAAFVKSKFERVQALPIYGAGVAFTACELNACNLHESELSSPDFEACALDRVDFHSSKLLQLSMRQTSVKNSSFYRCTLDGAYIRSSRFDACSFKMASLQSADLAGVTFDGCDLIGVDMRGVDLRSTKLVGGVLGSVEHAGVGYRTKIDDLPQNRRAIEYSGAVGIDSIEWCSVSAGSHHVPRIEGGGSCTKDGYWFTPAAKDSRRYFKAGEIMPKVASDFGLTLWQWDGE
jgi:uncharacterized protein YjbI with pentapeptide repeats